MSQKEIITESDFKRLSSFIADYEDDDNGSDVIDEKLSRATVVDTKDCPSDIITMHSKFLGIMSKPDGTDTSEREYTLVYPREADISAGRISVFSPLGAQLFAARAGDSVKWAGPDGRERCFKLVKVLYQPEASGDWHL